MRWWMITLAFVLASSWTNIGQSGEEGHGSHCPRCHETCYPTVTKDKEEKQCWNVETKTICIPKVRFPWESRCCDKGCGKDGCLPPKPGRTRTVNVLVPHKYECSTCKYSWDVDSYKHDSSPSDKKFLHGRSADDQPVAADPPPVEASLPRSNRRIAPVDFELSARR